MEYLHMQQPVAGLWGNASIIGVPVSIDAIDPNGNSVHIATVTSDGYSGTFSYTWTPTIAGDYMITATFMDDDSYGSSFATAYASFVEAPAVSTPTPAQTTLDTINNTTFIAGIIAVIIAVALATMLILRKRP